jgi:hypothetical protein
MRLRQYQEKDPVGIVVARPLLLTPTPNDSTHASHQTFPEE